MANTGFVAGAGTAVLGLAVVNSAFKPVVLPRHADYLTPQFGTKNKSVVIRNAGGILVPPALAFIEHPKTGRAGGAHRVWQITH